MEKQQFNKKFERLDYINDQLYDVGLVNSEIEHKQPRNIGFFVLQYAKMKFVELSLNFVVMYCVVTKFEELEMDTDSFYLALFGHDFYDCNRPAMRKEWNSLSLFLSLSLSLSLSLFLPSGECTEDFQPTH